MSMIGNFLPVSPEKLQSLIDNPESIPDFLCPDDEASEPPNLLDVDKAWHAIHFLLTGNAWGGELPLALALLGGIEIGEDEGYAPARYLTPEEVREDAAALSPLPTEKLAERYVPEALDKAEIYPEIWVQEGAEALE